MLILVVDGFHIYGRQEIISWTSVHENTHPTPTSSRGGVVGNFCMIVLLKVCIF